MEPGVMVMMMVNETYRRLLPLSLAAWYPSLLLAAARHLRAR